MADKAREWTDKKLAQMEKKINTTYQRASKELSEKWNAYMERGEKRISALQDAYSEALKGGDKEIIAEAKKTLADATESFTLKNDHYKEMVDSVTLDMAQINKQVVAYVNGEMPSVYAENYQQVRDILDDIKISYTLADKNTIIKMIEKGDVKTPFMRSDNYFKIEKDKRWNTKYINSEVLQGIIQGEDIRTISKRIFPEINSKTTYKGLSAKGIADRNRKSAIRNARTLTTGAENCGRLDSYHALADQGIVIKKVWIATGDDRTRDAHLVMDGQEVDIDEPFMDGDNNPLDYPADPSGEPATVYNCRCSMRTHIIGVQNEDGTIDYIDYEHEEGLHQREIEAEAERRNVEIPIEEQSVENESATNIFGESIQFSDAIIERHPEAKETIEKLATEFETKLKEVKVGNAKHTQDAGNVQISGTIMTINNFNDMSTTIHEFAHTISMENQTKFGLYNESDFWKEIKKVQRQYKKDVGDDTSRWISTYEHSQRGSDEFLAEAFAQAEMHEMGFELPNKYGNDFTYSNKVLEIVKEYFGKNKK